MTDRKPRWTATWRRSLCQWSRIGWTAIRTTVRTTSCGKSNWTSSTSGLCATGSSTLTITSRRPRPRRPRATWARLTVRWLRSPPPWRRPPARARRPAPRRHRASWSTAATVRCPCRRTCTGPTRRDVGGTTSPEPRHAACCARRRSARTCRFALAGDRPWRTCESELHRLQCRKEHLCYYYNDIFLRIITQTYKTKYFNKYIEHCNQAKTYFSCAQILLKVLSYNHVHVPTLLVSYHVPCTMYQSFKCKTTRHVLT